MDKQTIIISMDKTTDEDVNDFIAGLEDFINDGYDDEIENLRIIVEEDAGDFALLDLGGAHPLDPGFLDGGIS